MTLPSEPLATHRPPDPQFAERIRASFARQRVMSLLGASLSAVEPGRVAIVLPFREDLTQQHGYLHAGVITTIADSACGYAALSLLPAGKEVLSVEFKVNLLRPAAGESFIATAAVLKSGQTLTVARADVMASSGSGTTCVAAMQATIIAR